MTPEEVQDRITHAFQVERVLTRLGWVVLGIGAVSLAGIAALWLDAQVTLTTAMGAAAATLVGTVLAGASAYGSGTKIGIAASQFALAEQRFGTGTTEADSDPTN
jgi:hypothetical protein